LVANHKQAQFLFRDETQSAVPDHTTRWSYLPSSSLLQITNYHIQKVAYNRVYMLVLFGIGEIIHLFGYWLLFCSHALEVQGNNLELL